MGTTWRWNGRMGWVAAVLVGLTLAGGSAGAQPVVKIGYCAPFTGSAAEFGTNGWRGIQLALEDIEREGLILGGQAYRIEMITYDDRCEPSEGVSNVRRMIVEDKVSVILGSHCSSVCMAMAPLLYEFRVPGLTIECAADGVTQPGHDFYFRARPSMGLIAPLLTPHLDELSSPRKIGFIAVNDDYGRSFAESFKAAFAELDVETVAETYFERGTTDFRGPMNELRRARPDVIFYVGTAPEGALILRQAEEMGLTRSIRFVGAEEMSEMELLELAGPEAVEGTYAIGLWGRVDEAFADRVRRQFNAPMHYGIIYAYDAMMTVARAIRDAQSTDPVAIRDAMARIDLQGLQGRIHFETFDGYRNQGRCTPWLIQWRGGERHVVETR